jgi:hypothetical protein
VLEFQDIPDDEVSATHFRYALKYLQDRGITDADLINALNLQILPAATLFRNVYGGTSRDNRIAVVFPHYDSEGQMIPWWSARLVTAGQASGFMSMVGGQDQRGKMTCPPKEAPHAYLCPLNDWKSLEVGQKIYFHESCVKAINGALLGYHSIGLNGVAGYSSNKANIPLVSEIRDLPWKELGLQPIIVFDSNYEKWDVDRAITVLSDRLQSLCGTPPAIHLPLPQSPEGTHWGFDDFVVRHGAQKAKEYLGEHNQEQRVIDADELQVQLRDVNAEVVYVRNIARIVSQEDPSRILRRGEFTDLAFANRIIVRQKDDGTFQKVSVPKAWLEWKQRAEVDRLDYIPGAQGLHDGALNVWTPMSNAFQGDVEPALHLLRNSIRDKDIRKWVLDWLAYPVQNPGEKLTSALVFVGPPGVGKSLMAELMRKVYGRRNALSVDKATLGGAFNGVMAHRQFIVLDELYADSGSAMAFLNKVKKLITDTSIVVNTKGVPEYDATNCANYLITTNYMDSLPMDADDRRFCVVRFEPVEPVDQEYWTDFVYWMEEEVGYECWHHYLLQRDLTDFNPSAPAPYTSEKGEMRSVSVNAMESWVNDLREDPDQCLPLSDLGLFTSRELVEIFFEGDVRNPRGSAMSMGRNLTNLGFKKALDGKNIKVPGKQPARYWIIRNTGRFDDHACCVEHLRNPTETQGKF